MKVIYGINKIRKFRRPVVALGVFDGVHRGHRDILRGVVRRAHRIKGTSVVLTFWPHPQKKESLYSLEHRLRLIEEMGVEACIVVTFNQRFAAIPAGLFIKDILFEKIGAKEIFVGENFRFGRNAGADANTLKSLAPLYNYRVKVFSIIRIGNKTVSSTYIRSLIKKGKLYLAGNLLARPVSILGTVISGMRVGRRLGFPTANIEAHH